MPVGDATEIGEKGINLSGGQKARVALARAVYANPDVILMDDPISALDANVRKMIFEQVFVGLMKDKTRVLVTHAVEFLQLADHVIVMKDGRVEVQGTYEELQNNPYMTEIQEIHAKNKREMQKESIFEALEEITLGRKAKSTFAMSNAATFASDILDDVGPDFGRLASVQNPRKNLPKSAEAETDLPEEAPEEAPETESKPSTTSVASHGLVTLTDRQLDARLEAFRGATAEIDTKTSQILGKLLVNEEDEDVNPDRETYSKLFALVGGMLPVSIFVLYA